MIFIMYMMLALLLIEILHIRKKGLRIGALFMWIVVVMTAIIEFII